MQMIERVKAVVAKQLRMDVSEIADDAAIVEDLGADSLDIVEMLMTLEDELDIIIPDDATGLRTVKDVADFIDNEVK
ncbi:MAG: acyl carrier protein [Clostridia bacterium]|nr:acyl carrier protein [Clostridia bacterium]MBR5779038.1 acyl carrier protein [Clostridia bacterium]